MISCHCQFTVYCSPNNNNNCDQSLHLECLLQDSTVLSSSIFLMFAFLALVKGHCSGLITDKLSALSEPCHPLTSWCTPGNSTMPVVQYHTAEWTRSVRQWRVRLPLPPPLPLPTPAAAASTAGRGTAGGGREAQRWRPRRGTAAGRDSGTRHPAAIWRPWLERT